MNAMEWLNRYREEVIKRLQSKTNWGRNELESELMKAQITVQQEMLEKQ